MVKPGDTVKYVGGGRLRGKVGTYVGILPGDRARVTFFEGTVSHAALRAYFRKGQHVTYTCQTGPVPPGTAGVCTADEDPESERVPVAFGALVRVVPAECLT